MLQVVLYPNLILREVCEPIEEITAEVVELATEMGKGLFEWNAAGLSAPQVGKAWRMFVALLNDEPVTFINPEIIEKDEMKLWHPEGCISMPGVSAKVKDRSLTVTVKALDLEGNEFEKKLMSVEAIAVQHEIDHLNGVLMLDHISSVQRQMKKKKLKKIKKKIIAHGNHPYIV